MKRVKMFISILTLGLLFSQCSIVGDIIPKTARESGKWDVASGTGGGNNLSPRNHYYTFDVKGNNKIVTVTLEADLDAGFTVYDPLGQRVVHSYSGRTRMEEITLNEGTYTVLVYTEERYGIGSYTLKVEGASSGLSRMPFQRLRVENAKFSADGGGGVNYTFRNHLYKFETTEDNAIVDVSLDIKENNGFITLYNQLGERVVYTYTGRSKWAVEKLPKGIHTILIGTEERDALNSTYELNVFGKVQNLTQVSFQSQTMNSSWTGTGSTNTYTLRVTEDNSVLDIAMKSPDIDGYYQVFDQVGNRVDGVYPGRNRFTISAVIKGTYTIRTYPYQGSNKGNYSLIVYGQFADLKKQ